MSKSFRLPHERYSTLKERMVHPFASRSYEVLPALRDVSFEVRRGEFFGIVGRNGSGKSTVMKCLARIYRVDVGEIAVEGRVAPFFELGVGFNHELTARDNAVLNAVLLGLSPREARARLPEILAFAELEEFGDLKLKNFSSGMLVRLAFAVMVQVDADVLLFDEVLAVGDEAFQAKCLERFDELKRQGRTVLLVTHDMDSVERFCDRGLVLDRGRLVALGGPSMIADEYRAICARSGPLSATGSGESTDEHRVARPARGAGPPAFGSDPRRLFTLTRVLAAAEFKVRYLDAALSYFWTLIGPLAFFAILYVVFTQVGRFDHGVPHYGLYLLSATVLWIYFANATTAAIDCLVRNEGLLRRIPLPLAAIPLSVVVTALFDLCMSSLAALTFLLLSGLTPRAGWLELVPLMLGLSVLVTGVAMALAALYVRHRDMVHIWILARQLLFYASPIFYVAATVPDNLRPVLMANPLASILTELRHAVIDPAAPTAAAAIGGTVRLLVPVAIVVAAFGVGLWVFRREGPSVAEHV